MSSHGGYLYAVCISPDSKTLASGSDDNTIKLWNLDSFAEIKTLSGHRCEVLSVSFSPDCKTLASGSYDSTIKLWKLNNSSSYLFNAKGFKGNTPLINIFLFFYNFRFLIRRFSGLWLLEQTAAHIIE